MTPDELATLLTEVEQLHLWCGLVSRDNRHAEQVAMRAAPILAAEVRRLLALVETARAETAAMAEQLAIALR